MKRPVPRRICRDPHTVYCKAPHAHRGCCECWEYNNPARSMKDWRKHMQCNPYMLPEEIAKLKAWWEENHPDEPWEDQ